MDNIRNYFDQNAGQTEEEDFKDQPDEIEGQETPNGEWIPKTPPAVEVATPRAQRPSTPTVQLEESDDDQEQVGETEEDYSSVLSDARLRLEQGRLYEMVMKHDLFEGVDADTKAISNVVKEIRTYAQERMEIMLGMRQEKQEAGSGFPIESFPFNSLEVKVLKDLASAATKGASREAEPLSIDTPAPRKTLNPIGSNGHKRAVQEKSLPAKPKTPITRAKVSSTIQRILAEEGVTLDEVNEVFDPKKKYLSPDELASLTTEQVIERNRLIKNRQAASRNALPMPSAEQINMAIEQRANQAAANPQLQQIMGLLDDAQKRKGK